MRFINLVVGHVSLLVSFRVILDDVVADSFIVIVVVRFDEFVVVTVVFD